MLTDLLWNKTAHFRILHLILLTQFEQHTKRRTALKPATAAIHYSLYDTHLIFSESP